MKNQNSYLIKKAASLDGERRRELSLFQKQAFLHFKHLEMLNLALTHRSFANEQEHRVENNEKLEFLGDSVLGMVVSDYLFTRLPDKAEGDLARIKSFVVSEESLSRIARDIRVDNYILIGRGEEYSGGRTKKAILADAMEAVIGAHYLDMGIKESRKFILRYLIPEIERVLENRHKKDYKTLLQEYVQKKHKTYPRYRMVQKTGPDHDRTFWVEVTVNQKNYGPGSGKNKKEAEQDAAGLAYKALMGQM